MNKFVHNNFQSFKDEFEKEFKQNICLWIRDNIDIKESPNTRAIQVDDWFACKSLLKDPGEDFKKLCNRLFGGIQNLNGRSPHVYLADQINGTLKEALHAKKLARCYKDYDICVVSSEFNKTSKKRELYTKLNRSVNRKPDLRVVTDKSPVDIHIKANNTFLKSRKITFRGGRNPEYNSIESGDYYVHLLLSPTEYISIQNFEKLDKYIANKEKLSIKDENDWGGPGAVRFHFKNNVLDLVRTY